MWKILYRKEIGTGEVIVIEKNILKAIERYQEDFQFPIISVNEATDIDILN